VLQRTSGELYTESRLRGSFRFGLRQSNIASLKRRYSVTMDNQSLVQIESRILVLRGQNVIIDADLAKLYGVTTKRLNEQLKRNPERFPGDFMFRLTLQEKSEVVANCDHLARLKFSKSLPFALTEYGAIQAANVLASPLAIEMGIYVVRTFVRLRELAASNKELAQRLDELERKTDAVLLKQDAFERDAQVEFKRIIETLRQMMMPPPTPVKRPIGFVTPDDS